MRDTVLGQISSMGISIPVFGMVKDDRHRTRALVAPDGGDELEFRRSPAVFSLIGRIQEETHRFAITYPAQQLRQTQHEALVLWTTFPASERKAAQDQSC